MLFPQLYFRTTFFFSVNLSAFLHVISVLSGNSVSNERFFFLLMTTFLVFENVCVHSLHFMNLLVQMPECFFSLLTLEFREIISSLVSCTYK